MKIKDEVDAEMQKVIDQTAFINGPMVKEFATDLSEYLGAQHVIPCANGTDALQIAMMVYGWEKDSEVLVPSWTYVATVEVIALLGLKPVFVEVDPETFNIDLQDLEKKITKKTVAIVPVHLYGQCAEMESIMTIANAHDLVVMEDTAQALGADYTFSNGTKVKAGTIGHIGTTSFFPSKNLGCFGDGGALMCNDDDLARQLRMIANHGQSKKYHNTTIGVNSRLDTLQAAVLKVKLKHLDEYAAARNAAATFYDEKLATMDHVTAPKRAAHSNHVFHQYTMKLDTNIDRDALKSKLQERGIPSMVYYPIPNHLQEAYAYFGYSEGDLPVTEALSSCVLSLPIHTEMTEEIQQYIIGNFEECLRELAG